ncbi:MAG: hypothetical protein IPP51_02855 [Bacteroidetes bacterium]|nr:hypothetical protein [Bacteroidota bacterium]
MKFWTFLIVLLPIGTLAQEISTSNAVEQIESSFKEEEAISIDNIPESFAYLAENKIDLNSDAIESLTEAGLISQEQETSIRKHIERFGNIIATQELQVIDGFDNTFIKKILPFIYVDKVLAKEDSRQRITFRYSQGIKEYLPADFQGDPSKILIRLFRKIQRTLECRNSRRKDPGEKVIFGPGRHGFDFYSFFVQYKSAGLFRKIVVGDFALSFGQGLVCWTGIGFPSPANPVSLASPAGITPSTTTDENRYLRGIATEAIRGKFKFRAWLSSHRIDGRKETDTTENLSFISSLNTSGFHRSLNEESGYHTVNETYLGFNIDRSGARSVFGFTSGFQLFSLPILKDIRDYSRFDFRGKSLGVAGFHYATTLKSILLFGEAAISDNGRIAFLNGILFNASGNLTVSAIYHSYDEQFHSLKSNAFGYNTNPSNENGICFSLVLKPVRSLAVTLFTDNYLFPYIKYRTSYPSTYSNQGLLIIYTPSKKLNMQHRFQHRSKLQDVSGEYEGLKSSATLSTFNFRFSFGYKIDDHWEYRTHVEISSGKKIENLKSCYSISNDLLFATMKRKLAVSFRYAIYYCPEFDLKFYVYENDIPGSFSIPFYYGNGVDFI